VGKDGRALGMFEDESCAKPLADAELAALTPELRFFPPWKRASRPRGLRR